MVKIVKTDPVFVDAFTDTARVGEFPPHVKVKEDDAGVLDRLSHLVSPAWHALSDVVNAHGQGHRTRQQSHHPHVLPLISFYHSNGLELDTSHALTRVDRPRHEGAKQILARHPEHVQQLSEDFIVFAGRSIIYHALHAEKVAEERGNPSGFLSLRPEIFEECKIELFEARGQFREAVSDFFTTDEIINTDLEARRVVLEYAAQLGLAAPYPEYSKRRRTDFVKICLSGIIAEIKIHRALEAIRLRPEYASLELDMGNDDDLSAPRADIIIPDDSGVPMLVQVKSANKSGKELLIARPIEGIHQIYIGHGHRRNPIDLTDAARNKLKEYIAQYRITGDNDTYARIARGRDSKNRSNKGFDRPGSVRRQDRVAKVVFESQQRN